jgi:bacterioferritin
MGTYGKKIVDLDVNKLVKLLNKALADEWLAYYQYWIGARVAEGMMRGAAIVELNEHAADELRHADMLVERILQLGGKPILTPSKWEKLTNCGYETPSNFNVKAILKQNIKGEQCAIRVYKALVDLTKDKDPITYVMALEIMTDEVEHEDDLQALMTDMKK